MPDHVVYAVNYDAAVADLGTVSPDRIMEDGSHSVKFGPVGLIRKGSKAMGLVRADDSETQAELSQVVALGNLQVLGSFDDDKNFSPAFDGAEAIFRDMHPGTVTGSIGGHPFSVDIPDQFTVFCQERS